MAGVGSESALVVCAPEAEAAVNRFRTAYDPSAAAGVPAHITLLYPFKPPDELTESVIVGLRQCFGFQAPFRYSLACTRRFPGVLYLAPDPAEPFRQLTEAIVARHPETPPYGGRHTGIVPHLTVAHIEDEQRLDAVAEEFSATAQSRLPILAEATEATLLVSRSGQWRVLRTFRLGYASDETPAP